MWSSQTGFDVHPLTRKLARLSIIQMPSPIFKCQISSGQALNQFFSHLQEHISPHGSIILNWFLALKELYT